MPIDPQTGVFGTPISIGFDPDRIAVSSDGNNVFTVIGGKLAVQRYNTPTATPDQFFSISGGPRIDDMYAIPDRPAAVLLHEYSPNTSPSSVATVVYENAVLLPKQVGHGVGVGGPDIIAVDPTDGTKAYGYQSKISSYDHVPMLISEQGVDANGPSSLAGIMYGNVGRIAILGDKLFNSRGEIYSLSLGIQIAAFHPGESFLIDPSVDKLYSVASSGSAQTIRTYSLDTLTLLEIDTFSGINGTAGSLTRFSDNGLAFRTSAGKIAFAYIVQGGDYNADGVVDAADYTVWRDSFGQSGIGLPADGSGNGQIDASDYEFWLAQFGQVIGSGASLEFEPRASSIPEPPSVVVTSVIAFAMFVAVSRLGPHKSLSA